MSRRVFVPGKDGGKPAPRGECDACLEKDVPVTLIVVDGIELKLCVPEFLAPCNLRSRKGMSPQEYQEYLKRDELFTRAR